MLRPGIPSSPGTTLFSLRAAPFFFFPSLAKVRSLVLVWVGGVMAFDFLLSLMGGGTGWSEGV